MRTTEPIRTAARDRQTCAAGPVPARAPRAAGGHPGRRHGHPAGPRAPQAADPAHGRAQHHAAAAGRRPRGLRAGAPGSPWSSATAARRSCGPQPDLLFAYNQDYDAHQHLQEPAARAAHLPRPAACCGSTATWSSTRAVLDHARGADRADQSFVCVNTSTVAEEEVKYTLDDDGLHRRAVQDRRRRPRRGRGHQLRLRRRQGRADRAPRRACATRTTSSAASRPPSQQAGLRFRPLDISQFSAVEVDFEDDLARANTWLRSRVGAASRWPPSSTELQPQLRARPRRPPGPGGRGRPGRAPAGRPASRRPRRSRPRVSTASRRGAGDAVARAARRRPGRWPRPGGRPRRRPAPRRPPAPSCTPGRRVAAGLLARRRDPGEQPRRCPRREANGTLNSAAYRAASRGVRRCPRPPTMIGTPPGCTGLGSAGESVSG